MQGENRFIKLLFVFYCWGKFFFTDSVPQQTFFFFDMEAERDIKKTPKCSYSHFTFS